MSTIDLISIVIALMSASIAALMLAVSVVLAISSASAPCKKCVMKQQLDPVEPYKQIFDIKLTDGTSKKSCVCGLSEV